MLVNVEVSLRRMRSNVGDLVDEDDLATLETLLDGDGPAGVRQRGDLTVRATRAMWVGRRP